MDVTEVVAAQYRQVLGQSFVPTTQFASKPVGWSPERSKAAERRLATIRSYFAAVRQVAMDALAGSLPPTVQDMLFSEPMLGFGPDWHRNLPDEAWSDPLWFRTDESADGRIFEIQCPGSGWGDLHLLTEAYRELGFALDSSDSLTRQFASDCRDITGQDVPRIMHLIDNSSTPWSMRYFIEMTRGPVQYWGYDTNVGYRDVDLVRSHSFQGLVAENLFAARIQRLKEGSLFFDIPPTVLFDQKIGGVLPFHPETTSYFSDDVRELFPYTALAEERGFVGRQGEFLEWQSIHDGFRRDGTRYWLKYAGPNTSMNWGSMAVFRLGDSNQDRWIMPAVRGMESGQAWLVQEDLSTRLDHATSGSSHYEKVSCFYGPSGFYGAKHMFSQHFKSHGQPNTEISLGFLDG